RDAERGLYFVTDGRNEVIGCLLTTSPQTDHIIGYSGPNEVLIALDSRGAILALELLRSGDTREHVEKVQGNPHFLRRFLGWNPAEAPHPKVEAVSGAPLTSLASCEGMMDLCPGSGP